MIKQFYFKQFNLPEVICLHSIYISKSSIWSIDKTLSGATTPSQSGPGRMAMKSYSAFLKAPVLLEPHHQIV